MSTKPIVLAPIRARQAADSDSASRIPTTISLGLYESAHGANAPAREGLVPPLAYFCIRTLFGYADQVHILGSRRIRCQPEVLCALSPSTFGHSNTTTRCLCKLDPRLWSIIVQVYSGLPEGLRNYYIPLADRHLPLLQAIPSTPSFALITVLNLARCLSDDTSHVLKPLHGLCALDISDSHISHLGIRHFAPTVTAKQPESHYGTRGLRILRLNQCRNITDKVIGAVSNFPLLSVLDLRSTSCTRDLDPGVFRRCRKSQCDLFQCSLQDALQRLKDSDSRNILFSHPNPFAIHINTEFHPSRSQRPDHPKPAPVPSETASIQLQSHYHQDLLIIAERELREWIRSILRDAANEPRISGIVDFVVQRWEYGSKWMGSDRGHDPVFPLEDDDANDSWDEESSSSIEFCGYKMDGDLVERVWELVEDALKEHESAIRFYGLNSRTPEAVFCHCRELRGVATPPAETTPTDRHRMLVRDPPPWASVFGPDALPPQCIMFGAKPSLSESSYLNPDRSSTRAKKSIQEVVGMITQRSLPTIAIPSLPPIPTVSKNPFRRDSTRGLGRGGSKGLPQHRGGLAQGGHSDCVSDDPVPKRMKSISQIPIPPRPTPLVISQSTRAKIPNGGASGIASKKPGNRKQTTLLEMFGKRT